MKTVFSNCSTEPIFRSQSGFTLIEVTIAIVILVVGILGVFSMQLMTVKGNTNAIAISQSVNEASAALDKVESLDYTDDALDGKSGQAQTMDALYPDSEPVFRGTLTYNVTVLGDAVLTNKVFQLKNDDFTGSGYECKVIDMSAAQRSSGIDRTITLQYTKVNY